MISRRLERSVERFVLARADLVAAVNEDNRRYAISMGARQERTTVFRYGNLVAPAHFIAPRERPDTSEQLAELGLNGRSFILCIGRLERIKLPDHAIRALELVRARGIDAMLVLVGDGSMRLELETLASELGVRESVIFAGNRDQEWLARVIPHAAAVISPITGRALSEAALAGAPIIAYDLDWQRELVQSGVTGELVPAHDVAALAEATRRVLIDRAYAERIGSRLREAALAMMDPEQLDEHERRQYRNLLLRPS